jgi:hypothetical protein
MAVQRCAVGDWAQRVLTAEDVQPEVATHGAIALTA